MSDKEKVKKYDEKILKQRESYKRRMAKMSIEDKKKMWKKQSEAYSRKNTLLRLFVEQDSVKELWNKFITEQK